MSHIWKVTMYNGVTGKEHVRLCQAETSAEAASRIIQDVEDDTPIKDLPAHWRIDIDLVRDIEEGEE